MRRNVVSSPTALDMFVPALARDTFAQNVRRMHFVEGS
jgi:hypothetical protein